MRVIWISAGLLAAFLVVLGLVYEPSSDQMQLASSSETVVENPFVEENQGAITKESNESVDLAVLPTESDGSSVEPGTQELDQTPVAQIVKENNEPVATAKTGDTTSEDINVVADNFNSIVVEKPEAPEKEKKKLGLAMLAFEKEKKKNKVAVIVHETNTQMLTEKEIKALYMDRLTRWQDGSKVMLYNLPLGDKHRDKFSKSVLKMSALEADTQESKRRELRIKANDVQVKAKNVIVSYVEQHPNAVAYVPLDLVREKSSVKVVLTIP